MHVSLLPRHGAQMVSPGVKEAPLPLSTRVVQLVTGGYQLCQSLQIGTESPGSANKPRLSSAALILPRKRRAVVLYGKKQGSLSPSALFGLPFHR